MQKPKGKLIAIGGAVDRGTEEETPLTEENGLKFFDLGILARIMKELRGKTHRVEIVTTASKIPAETGENYSSAFARLGHTNTGVINISSRDEANDASYIRRIEEAEGVLFSGGNQLRLTTILGGSDFIKTLLRLYLEDDYLVAGTSAGAMALSDTMIYYGSSSEALLRGEVKLSHGFGFIENVTFDSHFVKRGRFGRICQAVVTNPGCLGVGLGEDTGLLITNGDRMEAIGSGLVVIVDGNHIRYTNIADIEDKQPIAIENLSVHILAMGCGFILSERKFFSTPSA